MRGDDKWGEKAAVRKKCKGIITAAVQQSINVLASSLNESSKKYPIMFLAERTYLANVVYYVSDGASSSLECTTWANVAIYGSVEIRSFRRVTNTSAI